MSTQTSIFTFDHNKQDKCEAIGVTKAYMNDLQEQITETLKNFVFDEHKQPREGMSASRLVEACATEFSYSQLVVMAAFFLEDKLDDFSKSLEGKLKQMKSSIRTLALDPDDVPPHILKMLKDLSEGTSRDNPVDGESLPKEVKDFLDGIVKEQLEEGEGDDE